MVQSGTLNRTWLCKPVFRKFRSPVEQQEFKAKDQLWSDFMKNIYQTMSNQQTTREAHVNMIPIAILGTLRI